MTFNSIAAFMSHISSTSNLPHAVPLYLQSSSLPYSHVPTYGGLTAPHDKNAALRTFTRHALQQTDSVLRIVGESTNATFANPSASANITEVDQLTPQAFLAIPDRTLTYKGFTISFLDLQTASVDTEKSLNILQKHIGAFAERMPKAWLQKLQHNTPTHLYNEEGDKSDNPFLQNGRARAYYDGSNVVLKLFSSNYQLRENKATFWHEMLHAVENIISELAQEQMIDGNDEGGLVDEVCQQSAQDCTQLKGVQARAWQQGNQTNAEIALAQQKIGWLQNAYAQTLKANPKTKAPNLCYDAQQHSRYMCSNAGEFFSVLGGAFLNRASAHYSAVGGEPRAITQLPTFERLVTQAPALADVVARILDINQTEMEALKNQHRRFAESAAPSVNMASSTSMVLLMTCAGVFVISGAGKIDN